MIKLHVGIGHGRKSDTTRTEFLLRVVHACNRTQ